MQIVAFGLGLMVLLLLGVVRNDILQAWQQSLPDDAPNQFLINISPDQLEPLSTFLREELGSEPASLPLIRGRITHINEIRVEEMEFPDPQGANFVRRETNLTWAGELPESNRIRKGEWWGADYDGPVQVSLDAGMAESLGIGLGDRLGFSVGGERVEAPVTSIRTIAWDSLEPNFFIMLPPGRAEALPQTYLASLYVPPERFEVLNRLVRNFPGITILDLDVILAQVRTVIDRASLAVQYVFLFTLIAGVLVLLAAVQLTRDERRFESALLHTLGARRTTILKGVAAEFIVLGALAGILAAIGATVVGAVLASLVFDIVYRVSLLPWVIGLLAGALIVGIAGTLATWRAVSTSPVVVLREG